jgi:hypothetical protein
MKCAPFVLELSPVFGVVETLPPNGAPDSGSGRCRHLLRELAVMTPSLGAVCGRWFYAWAGARPAEPGGGAPVQNADYARGADVAQASRLTIPDRAAP